MKSLLKSTVLFSLLFFLSCAVTGKRPAPAPDPYWNELARFLAGIPGRHESVFKKFETLDFYRNHADSMDKFWNRVQRETIDLITPWRGQHIESRAEAGTAFYPFSGADFINLYTFFPAAHTYIMVALEEPGPVPAPLDLSPQQLSQGFSAVRRTISTIASENYFQSGIMKREMTNRHLRGALPVLMIFTARLNLSITSVEAVALDARGAVSPLDRDGNIDGKKPEIYGYRIGFIRPDSRVESKLVYLKMRLHDSCLRPGHPAAGFFQNMPLSNTLIKSAVYLLHSSDFSGLCCLILNKSAIIIEDDSGIPYSYFKSDTWNTRLFGAYNYPQKLRDLPNPPRQEALAAAFLAGHDPIPFNFGYGVKRGKGKSNLLLAIKRAELLQK